MDKVDRNRLEEFRQLRQEVRHSEEYLIVGIDIAKDRHHAFFGTATGGTLLKRLVFWKIGKIGTAPIVFGIVFERSLIILKHLLFSLASSGNFCYISIHGAEPRHSGTPGYLPRHWPHSFSGRSIPAAGTNVHLQRVMSNLELASTQRRLEGYGLQRTPSPFGPERSH